MMSKATKVFTRLAALVLSVSMLTGCTTSGADNSGTTEAAQTEEAQEIETVKEENGETRIVVDALGREVEVPVNPQRIAIPPMVLPNMVYALQGHAKNIVSMAPSAYSGWEISMLRYLAPELEGVDTTMCNDDYSVNVEALLASDVDLVINFSTQTDQAAQLEAVGIPCVLVEFASDLESLKALMTIMGDALNCNERTAKALAWYEEVEAYFASKADEVAALSEDEKPRVLNLQRVEKLQAQTTGVSTLITNMQGGKAFQLAADVTSPTMEDLLAYDPEIIFISNFDEIIPEDFYENRIEGQDWSSVSAVKNRRVYKVAAGLYRWSPPLTFEKPLYMLWTASIVQPEIFSDIDIRSTVKEFYQDFYGYELSEEQMDEIFRTEVNSLSQQ